MGRRKYSIQPPASSLRSRRMVLEQLSKADGWLDTQELRIESGISLLNIINAFLKMGAIDTKPGKDGVVLARVTMYGRALLIEGRFTYADTIVNFGLPKDTYRRAEELAKKLGMIHRAGRGAGRSGSIIALVRAVVNRPEAFEKWYRNIYAEELEE